MTRIPTVTALVERARKRLAIQLVYEQIAWGAVAGLCGFLLLLLTGTQVLRWYWPLVLLVATAAIGWWRVRHKIPSAYRTAQRVDAAAGAGDVLATAWYFSAGDAKYPPRADYLDPLQQNAEQAASSVSLPNVLPWQRPAATWPLVALILIAGVTFGIRYGVTNSIDMSAPMAEVSFDTLTGAPVVASEKRPGANKHALPTPEGVTLPDEEGSQVQESPFAREEQLKSFEVASNQISQAGKGERGNPGENGEAGEEGNTGDEEGGEDGQQSTPSGSKDAGKKSAKDAPKQPENDGGLMDKMRDALANLMDKFKMDPMEGDQQQMASNKRGGKKSGQGKKQQGERGKDQKDSQQGDSEDGQGDQQGEGEQGQMAKSQNSQANEQAGKSDKSGVGTQDGKKETELAEHAEAMGKLSELLGKRSKELQGEVMVEVTNSKNQQARTAFTGKKSAHSDSGGELNRDEVPLHLQHYVQQYYEAVRKQTPAPPPPAPVPPQSGAKQ